MQPFALLIAGFLLTSVAGGMLGYAFQQRAWRHQHEVEREDQLRDRALETFGEVSTLLDRRLYRMRQLYWALKRRAKSGATSDAYEEPRGEYRAVLKIWNDNLNRTLALVEVYFGAAIRVRLEIGLYEEFAAAGEELEQFLRDVAAPTSVPVRVRFLGPRLDSIGHAIYSLNVLMLTCVREGELGEQAPTTIPPYPEQNTIRFGHKGARVRQLQEALREAGEPNLACDGHFGLDTENALRSFQRAHELRDDGVAGVATLNTLDLDNTTG